MPTFNEADCTCEHDATAHDDGFGCTEPECPCLAQWHFEYGGGAW
jgi:hypothetical protein